MRDNRMLLIEHLIESSVVGYTITPVRGLADIADAYIPVVGKRIFIDEEQYLSAHSYRFRFTLAEELAHILLHVPLFKGKSPKEIQSMRDSISDDDYKWIEMEAKYLAGCLLMPKSDFVERFKHFYGIKSQQTTNQRKILVYVFRQLNIDFNVSCVSCAIRALKLKLIDQDQYDEVSESFSGPMIS
jgi:Zn-dependent peptidase ImmA (M78 family)